MTVTFDNPDTLFTARDVAAYRRVSEQALAAERFRGTGPRFVKIGRRVMYRACDLAEFIEARIR